jgi:hypothetical protein
LPNSAGRDLRVRLVQRAGLKPPIGRNLLRQVRPVRARAYCDVLADMVTPASDAVTREHGLSSAQLAADRTRLKAASLRTGSRPRSAQASTRRGLWSTIPMIAQGSRTAG